ncbi:phage tail tape measure protein, partial [bacterium]|nr:phage tail tape measure protein [bacterium]
RQFQNTLKKSTDVDSIKALNTNITFLEGKISHLNSRIGEMGKPVGDATQSLVNFSRIAQDAPYGIIGIANNLNPMLESFQRLAKTEGGTKKALTAMIDGLAGPAGLGVVLGIVSSLAVVFSKQIGEAFTGSTDKVKELREELKKLNDDVYKITGAAQTSQILGGTLAGVISNKSVDINTRKNALKEFKKLYGENKQIQDLDVKNIDNYTKSYLSSLNNLAAVQKDAIGKEKNYIDALTAANAAYKKLIDERDKQKDKQLATTKQLEMGITTESLKAKIDAQYVKPLKEAKKDIDNAKDALTRTITDVLKFDTPETIKKVGTKPKPKKIKSPVKLISDGFYDASLEEQAREQLSKTPFVSKIPEVANIGNGTLFGMFDEKMNAKIKTTKNELSDFLKETKDGFKQANNEAYQFASQMSGGITNSLQSAFDALISGENVFEALSKSVLQFAEDLAFAILRAEILAAIQGTIATSGAGVAGAAAGGSGFFNVLMNLLGLGVTKNAAGGITNGPSLGLIGEAGPEAIMPLSKLSSFLNTSFNAGSMSGGNSSNGGQFVLRGQDLLLAVNRSQKASNIKGQSISL